jgi:flagellar biosynthesis protein FliQ
VPRGTISPITYALFTESQAQALGRDTKSLQYEKDSLRFFDYGSKVLKLETKNHLKTTDLLKVKGAGWFSDLFSKIFGFFKEIFQKIVSVLKKLVQTITQFFTKVFGKTIGNALASIVLGGLQYLVNTLDYIANGDFKGLLKYWGQLLIQMAVQLVVAVIAPYLIGAVAAVLGWLFNALGQIAIAAASYLPSILNGISTALTWIGKGFVAIGGRLTDFATKMFAKGGEYFTKLLDNTSSFIKDALNGGFTSFLKKLNPISAMKDLTTLVKNPLDSLSAFFKPLTQTATNFYDYAAKKIWDLGTKLGLQIGSQKLDRELEKKGVDSFWRSIITTAASSGLGAVIDIATQGGAAVIGPLSKGLEAIGGGLEKIFVGAKNVFSSLAHGIFGSRAPPVNSPAYQFAQNGYTIIPDPATGKPLYAVREDPETGIRVTVQFNQEGGAVAATVNKPGQPSQVFDFLDPTNPREGVVLLDLDGGRRAEIADGIQPSQPDVRFIDNLPPTSRDPFSTPSDYSDLAKFNYEPPSYLPDDFPINDLPLEPLKDPFSVSDFMKAFKFGAGTAALVGGVRLENTLMAVIEGGTLVGFEKYTKVLGKGWALPFAKLDPNVRLRPSSALEVAKYRNVGASLTSYFKTGVALGVATVLVDDISYGLATGQSAREIAVNVAIDSAVSIVSGTIGALAAGALTPLPGLNIMFSVGVSWAVGKGLNILLDKFGIRKSIHELAGTKSPLEETTPSQALQDIQDRYIEEAMMRDYIRRSYYPPLYYPPLL